MAASEGAGRGWAAPDSSSFSRALLRGGGVSPLAGGAKGDVDAPRARSAAVFGTFSRSDSVVKSRAIVTAGRSSSPKFP